jgi:hypothetical protein
MIAWPVLGSILHRALPYVLGALFVALVAWWGYRVANSWCNGACEDAREELAAVTLERDGLLEGIKAAQDRASALAVLWADAIQRVEVRYVEATRESSALFAGLRERAGRIRPATSTVSVPVPAGALGVLIDAHRSANGGQDPAAAGGDRGAPEAVPEAAGGAVTHLDEWVTFATDAAEAYADARQKHLACVAWAGSITQQQEKTP